VNRRPCADEDDEPVMGAYLGIGSLHHVKDPDSAEETAAGRLYIPDLTQRSGWWMHLVPRPSSPSSSTSPRRPVGFRVRR